LADLFVCLLVCLFICWKDICFKFIKTFFQQKKIERNKLKHTHYWCNPNNSSQKATSLQHLSTYNLTHPKTCFHHNFWTEANRKPNHASLTNSIHWLR
jgi:hypothetical protein